MQRPLIIAIAAVVILAAGGGAAVWSQRQKQPDQVASTMPAASTLPKDASQAPKQDPTKGGTALLPYDPQPLDFVIGKADAPNTIIEYFSLTCPHCARFATEVEPQLKTQWIDTGKAKLVLRDFPLDNLALAAALVSHCSGTRYGVFVDTFFKSQGTWATASDPKAAISGIARLGGMSAADVDSCLNNTALVQQITDVRTDANKKMGIDSTPSFIVNGKLNVGETSLEQFDKLLQSASN